MSSKTNVMTSGVVGPVEPTSEFVSVVGAKHQSSPLSC